MFMGNSKQRYIGKILRNVEKTLGNNDKHNAGFHSSCPSVTDHTTKWVLYFKRQNFA